MHALQQKIAVALAFRCVFRCKTARCKNAQANVLAEQRTSFYSDHSIHFENQRVGFVISEAFSMKDEGSLFSL